jgi:hypothetical protein
MFIDQGMVFNVTLILWAVDLLAAAYRCWTTTKAFLPHGTRETLP